MESEKGIQVQIQVQIQVNLLFTDSSANSYDSYAQIGNEKQPRHTL